MSFSSSRTTTQASLEAAEDTEGYMLDKEEAMSELQHKVEQATAGKIFDAFVGHMREQQQTHVNDERNEVELLQAAKDGNLVKIKLLLSHPVDMLFQDHKGYTCMHMAVKGGHMGVMRELAAQGGLALLSKRSNSGQTPQEYAMMKGLVAANNELGRLEEEIHEANTRQQQREDRAFERADAMTAEYNPEAESHPLNKDEYRNMIQAILLAAAEAGESSGQRDDSRLHKFIAEPRELICGEFEHAAKGFFRLLHVDEDDISLRSVKGVGAIEEEVQELGNERLFEELDYILRHPAREKWFPNGVRDKGRAGMRLHDFMQHEHAKIAELKEAEVVALRLYTSPVFEAINAPLRDHDRINRGIPHPLPVTVNMISKGIKKLRAVGANDDAAIQARVLWRGMRNLLPTDQFSQRGGTEVCAKHAHVFTCLCIRDAVTWHEESSCC
jgi:hypothetical protein